MKNGKSDASAKPRPDPAIFFLPFSIQRRDITVHSPSLPTMSMFRAKKLDLGCFVKVRTIRDHTKRKVFEQFEAERYAPPPPPPRGFSPMMPRYPRKKPRFYEKIANFQEARSKEC